jgi:hypothetical protein
MPEEGFFRRWARVKASGAEAVAEAPPAVAPPAPAAPALDAAPVQPQPQQQPAPTLLDAARLTPDSDFSAFVSPHVDQDVRRLALKKLFADPHFNVMDRLDMYMDDYNKPDPVSATMLAALGHARSALRRPEEVQEEIARLAARDAPATVTQAALPDPQPHVDEEEQGVSAEAAVLAGEGAPEASADLPAAALLPDAAEHDSDVIALTAVRAHNMEACQ